MFNQECQQNKLRFSLGGNGEISCILFYVHYYFQNILFFFTRYPSSSYRRQSRIRVKTRLRRGPTLPSSVVFGIPGAWKRTSLWAPIGLRSLEPISNPVGCCDSGQWDYIQYKMSKLTTKARVLSLFFNYRPIFPILRIFSDFWLFCKQ